MEVEASGGLGEWYESHPVVVAQQLNGPVVLQLTTEVVLLSPAAHHTEDKTKASQLN